MLDSNILVAGLPSVRGQLADIVGRWVDQRFTLVLSEYILSEIERAWAKPYWQTRLDHDDIDIFLYLLRTSADVVSLRFVSVIGIASHPQDDPVIATAISGNASLIVTGDREFLRVRQYEGVEIISPQDFLTRLDKTDAS